MVHHPELALRAAPHHRDLVFERLPLALVLAPGLPRLFQRLQCSSASATSRKSQVIQWESGNVQKLRSSNIRCVGDKRRNKGLETPTFFSSMSVCRSISRICSTVMPYHSSIHAKHSRWHAKNSALCPCMDEARCIISSGLLNPEEVKRLWTYAHSERTAMMQSSSRSPKPQIGASMVTSLYVVMTGRHESCSKHHA